MQAERSARHAGERAGRAHVVGHQRLRHQQKPRLRNPAHARQGNISSHTRIHQFNLSYSIAIHVCEKVLRCVHVYGLLCLMTSAPGDAAVLHARRGAERRRQGRDDRRAPRPLQLPQRGARVHRPAARLRPVQVSASSSCTTRTSTGQCIVQLHDSDQSDKCIVKL